MKLAIFDAKEYDRTWFDKENRGRHKITYFEENLSLENLDKAKGFDAVCGFVNTPCDAAIISGLVDRKVKIWLQRSMGYNRIDLRAAERYGMHAFSIPNYSAETVGEHALTLMLSLNRQIVKAARRTTNYDFSLNGLEGRVVFGSTVGVLGAGKIGKTFIAGAVGMGANVLVYDEFAQKNSPDTATQMRFKWATLDQLLAESDFISIHTPLLPTTEHLINEKAINKMKKGVLIINTSRGPIVDTTALLAGLKSGKIGGAGLDVLEREAGRFFFNRSKDKAKIAKEDPEWAELLKMDNVIVTAHQAFFTNVALSQIAQITLKNLDDAQQGNFEKALKLQPDGRVLNG